jgi:hypothetical protein
VILSATYHFIKGFFMPRTQRLIMEGDQVVVEQVTRVGSCSVTDFLTRSTTLRPVNTGILPSNTIFYQQESEEVIKILIQLDPCARRVTYKRANAGSDHPTEELVIATPFVTFGFRCDPRHTTIGRVLIACSKTPLNELSDELLIFPVTNVYPEDGRICTGNVRADGATIRAKVNSFVNGFFASEFNTDIVPPVPEGWPSRSHTMVTWASKSEGNPLFALTPGFNPARHPYRTAQRFIDGLS